MRRYDDLIKEIHQVNLCKTAPIVHYLRFDTSLVDGPRLSRILDLEFILVFAVQIYDLVTESCLLNRLFEIIKR